MSAEIRHGPVTMHRAVERALMKTLRARAPDAPRAATATEGDAPAEPGRADSNRDAPSRGGRGGRPTVRAATPRGDGGAR